MPASISRDVVNCGRIVGVMTIAVALCTAGCAQGEKAGSRSSAASTAPATVGSDAAHSSKTAKDLLFEASTTFWEARRTEDWATLFPFDSAYGKEGATFELYVQHMTTREPLKVHAATVHGVEVSDAYGWVDVEVTTSIQKLPDVPKRTHRRWERWRLADGHWKPVAAQEWEFYPDAPAVRNAAEEARLREAFEASWPLREREDFSALYSTIDPSDVESVTLEGFQGLMKPFNFLSKDVKWIQVVGDRGVVRVEYVADLADENLQNLPPEVMPVSEQWVLREGVWRLDLNPKN